MELVKNNINLSKILYRVKPEYREIVKSLIDKKQKIIEQNGLFASFRINKINRKIEKYLLK